MLGDLLRLEALPDQGPLVLILALRDVLRLRALLQRLLLGLDPLIRKRRALLQQLW